MALSLSVHGYLPSYYHSCFCTPTIRAGVPPKADVKSGMPPRCPPSSSRLTLAAAASRQAALPVPSFLAPSLQPRRGSTHPRTNSSFRASTLTQPPARRPLTTSSRIASSSTPSSSASSSTTTTSRRETIFALATSTTASRPSGVAIVRISGPLVPSLYFRLTLTSLLRPYATLPAPARFVVRNIHHPSTRELLDAGAGVIYFPPHRSYTTDATLELHVHGGVATVRDVLEALGEVEGGVRVAEPGEFTRRAWEGGRLSLTQVEGLGELIGAETSVQRRVALYGSTGKQTMRFEAIRSELVAAMTSVEALIDFSEDGVEEGTISTAVESVANVAALLRREVEGKGGKSVGEILTNGIRLAIYGPPNAGKSSLLNTLADRNAAIVSDVPGTTRDVLEVHLDLNGYKVVVYDTAGIRPDAGNEIERIGIDRARQAVDTADLALLVLPSTQPLDPQMLLRPAGYTEADEDLVYFNKSDLAQPQSCVHRARCWSGSLLTNTGVSELVQGLAQQISRKYELSATEAPLITQARHRTLLRQCLRHVEAFRALVEGQEADLVLAAEELRYAAREIGKVTGRGVTVDEILGSIFSNFCIGK